MKTTMGFWLFHSWLETGCLIAFCYPTGTSQKGVFSIFISSPFFTVWKTERERERDEIVDNLDIPEQFHALIITVFKYLHGQ